MAKIMKRLSQALCETVDFGYPKLIRIAADDMKRLMEEAELNCDKGLPIEYEAVKIEVEQLPFKGCVVEHDGRYMEPGEDEIPEKLVRMNDSGRMAHVAWREI